MTAAARAHNVDVDNAAFPPTASCAPCRWSATDPNPEHLALAVGRHVGVAVRPRLRIVRCHAICYDEHGHTDGCLIDGPET